MTEPYDGDTSFSYMLRTRLKYDSNDVNPFLYNDPASSVTYRLLYADSSTAPDL